MAAIAAVAVVLAAASGVLTVALARRLAEHGRRLASLERVFGSAHDPFLDGLVGTRVPGFDRPTTRGDRVSDASLAGAPAVVAFLAPDCPACTAQVDELVTAIGAGELPRTVAVVRGDGAPGSAEAFVDRLAPACDVVLDPDGSLATAFAVPVAPAVLALDAAGVVVAAASSAREILTTTATPAR